MTQPRVRRSAAESKRIILDAAEHLLVEGGPAAVEVRGIAHLVGMTDAGVAHHFGTRDELLVALLTHGGHRLRDAVEEAVAAWAEGEVSVDQLVSRMAAVYALGYGPLAMSLYAAGWRDSGSGMLAKAVDALELAVSARGSKDVSRRDIELAVAALHQAIAVESAYGNAFRRSAGVSKRDAARPDQQLRWWVRTLAENLGLDR